MIYDPKQDGVDHINVYSKGNTSLGKALSNFASIGFTHPEHGRFESVEGFWYWIATGMIHNQLRALTGFSAKQFGKTLERIDHPDFKREIKSALFYKVEQNQKLFDALKQSTLPFTHYYYYGSVDNCKVNTVKDVEWIIEYLELIRKHAKGEAQKVVIAGSRGYDNVELVRKALKDSKYNPVLGISGGASGIDKLGELVFEELNIPVRKFIPDWDGLGKPAGMIRNKAMADYADAVIAIWDGKSKGTKQMITYSSQKCPTFVTTQSLPKQDEVTYTSIENDPHVNLENSIEFKTHSAKRVLWLKAAQVYYLSPGDDSGVSDYEWDYLGRELYKVKHLFPLCPILNNPNYEGGSLFWVKRDMYSQALALYKI